MIFGSCGDQTQSDPMHVDTERVERIIPSGQVTQFRRTDNTLGVCAQGILIIAMGEGKRFVVVGNVTNIIIIKTSAPSRDVRCCACPGASLCVL